MAVTFPAGNRSAGDDAQRPQLASPTVVPVVGRARSQLAFPLDGRYGPMDPLEMNAAVAWLVRMMHVADVDYVLGIPEGGNAPAFAFASATGLRVIFASIWRPAANGVVSFREAHDNPPADWKHVSGLTAGDRVVLIEDEVTSGATAISCVRALRAAGIACDEVGTLYAADDAAMGARLAAEGIALHAVSRFPARISAELYR